MAHVRRQNGYRGVQLGSTTSQENSRSCKKVSMPKVPDVLQPNSSTSCHTYSAEGSHNNHRLSTASVGNELYSGSRNVVYSPTFSSKYFTMGKTGQTGDILPMRAIQQPLLENTTPKAKSTLVNGPSNYCSTTAVCMSSPHQRRPFTPRACDVERDKALARPSCHPDAGALDGQDPLSTETIMNLLPVINNLRLEDNCLQSIHNPFPLMQTGNASNRNSTGSTSSQTSSGFESGKTGSSTGGDSSNIVSSNSSSSCTSSNLVPAGPSTMDSPSSRISSSDSTTSGGRLSSYNTSMDEYYCDPAGGLGCSSTGGSNIISPEINITSRQPKSRKAASTCSRVNIREMMARGIPESEIMAEWLQRLCLSQCLALFISQGYDLISISRITPEDLTTLGISKPADRQRLMQDIQHWNIVDNWPAHVSGDSGIRDWLISIGLTQYIDLLESQGYTTMHELQKVTWEDLEDIGIKKLGHMKKICLALKKLKLSRSRCLKEDISNLADCDDYGTLQPHHLRHVPPPCSPGTSATTSSTFQQPSSSGGLDSGHHQFIQKRQFVRNDPGYGTTQPPNCYDNSAFTSPYMAVNRKHSQPLQNQQRQEHRLLDANLKQRPIVTVRPNKQLIPSLENEELDDGSVIYKNSCFGLPKLNLYRTSQILSEFSELPKSIDGQPLAYQRYNDPPFYTHDCPPPPAPMPSIAASRQANACRPDECKVTSTPTYANYSYSQPATPRDAPKMETLHQRTNF